MKILFYNIHNLHRKNRDALLSYNFDYTISNDANIISNFNIVYSPCIPIDVKKYPDTKFIFGPHFSVFPIESQMNIIRCDKDKNNTTYIQPSIWATDVWKNNTLCKDIVLKPCPFAVDIDRFRPSISSGDKVLDKVFIYFKRRNPNELNFVKHFLDTKKIEYSVFVYGSYNENNYLDFLHRAKYGIWIGSHESQGFALQEALSCNIPLLVWNATSMNMEYGSSYDNIAASSIPYWDSRCGEYFTDKDNLEATYNNFIEKIDTYKPREYVVANLSKQVCRQRFIDIVST